MNFNTNLETIFKSKTIDLNRKLHICIIGSVNHGKSTFFESVANMDIISKEKSGITQDVNIFYNNDIMLADLPGHQDFNLLYDILSDVCDVCIICISPFQADKQTIKKYLEFTEKYFLYRFIVLTKYDKYVNDYNNNLDIQLQKINIFNFGGNENIFTVDYNKTSNNANDKINRHSPQEIINEILCYKEFIEPKKIPSNKSLYYILNYKKHKKLGDFYYIINLNNTNITNKSTIAGLNVKYVVNTKNMFLDTKTDDWVTSIKLKNNAQLKTFHFCDDTQYLLYNTPIQKQNHKNDHKYSQNVYIFAENQTKLSVLYKYLNTLEYIICCGSVVGFPNKLILSDIQYSNMTVIYFGDNYHDFLKYKIPNSIASDSFYVIDEKIKQLIYQQTQKQNLEVFYNKIGKIRVKKIFQILNNSIWGCDLISHNISLQTKLFFIDNKNTVHELSIKSLKIKNDNVIKINDPCEFGMVLNEKIDLKVGYYLYFD